MKNKKIKKSLILLLVAVLCVVPLTACGGGGDSDDSAKSDETFAIKFGHVMDTTHSYHAGAEKFKELIEEKSDGRITVEVFPNSQLGAEREMVEGMQLNTIDMGMSGTSAVSGIIPEWQVFDLPYLFTDYDEGFAAYDSDVGQSLLDASIDDGVRGLAYGNMGLRSVYSNKGPIETVDDFKGLKIRTMESPIPLAAFKALGGSPVSMAYTEVYSALEQGVIDAAENSISALYTSKHYEAAPYFSLTNHNLIPVVLFMSEELYQSLPEDLQGILVDCAKEAMKHQREVQLSDDDANLAKLEEAGVKVNKIDDLEPFIDKVRPVWESSMKDVPNGKENLDAILKIAEEVRGQ